MSGKLAEIKRRWEISLKFKKMEMAGKLEFEKVKEKIVR